MMIEPYWEKDGITIYCGANEAILPQLSGIDCILTDPPYGFGFMGKGWDTFKPENVSAFKKKADARAIERNDGRKAGHGVARDAGAYDQSLKGHHNFQEWCKEWSVLALEACKPGAMMMCFGGPRTYHRLTCGIEDAGWQIRDCLMWLFSTGFPKSHNFGCKCRGENEKTKSNTEHSMRSMSETNLSQAVQSEKSEKEILLDTLPEQSLSEYRTTRPQSKLSDGEESSMEGRELHRAKEGVSTNTNAESSKSKERRLRSGTYSSDGKDIRQTFETKGSSASQGQEQIKQSSIESGSLQFPQRTLDEGTSGRCETCGRLKAFKGFGTALKPSYEPIVLAMKPLDGTFAQNAEKHGVAGLAIDKCRIKCGERLHRDATAKTTPSMFGAMGGSRAIGTTIEGRWPANLLLDEESSALLDQVSGDRPGSHDQVSSESNNSLFTGNGKYDGKGNNDSGGASRFFYIAKADNGDRGNQESQELPLFQTTDPGLKNLHPTVKPLELMENLIILQTYLLNLMSTPTGGLILDPFMGSGSTLVAAKRMGRSAIGIEKEEAYCKIAIERLKRKPKPLIQI